MKLIPPKVQAKINPRHKLSSNAIAKAEKFKDCTCAPPEILAKDIAAYNAGNFSKIRGNLLINVRGLLYGLQTVIFEIKLDYTPIYPCV